MPSKYSKFKKVLRILTFSLVGIYVISATTLYFYQDKLIFKGWKLDKDFQCQIGTEIKISGEDGSIKSLGRKRCYHPYPHKHYYRQARDG